MKAGLHGVAIQWGGVGDVGVLADTLGEIEVGCMLNMFVDYSMDIVLNCQRMSYRRLINSFYYFQVGGTKPQSVRSVLECLDTLLLAGCPVVSSFCLASSSTKSDGSGGASLLKAVANILGWWQV